MAINTSSVASMVSELSHGIAKATETEIFSQLQELVSRGLLVVEQTQPVITHDQESNKLNYSMKVRLLLKDQEYVEKLEERINDLSFELDTLQRVYDMNRQYVETAKQVKATDNEFNAACDAEITKLRAENKELKEAMERIVSLTHSWVIAEKTAHCNHTYGAIREVVKAVTLGRTT